MIMPTISSTTCTLDISSTPWRTVGIPFCPGCPTMGAPLALVSRKRRSPRARSPAGLMKRASSSWPISCGSVWPGIVTITRPVRVSCTEVAFSGTTMAGSSKSPSSLTIWPSPSISHAPARV